MVVEISPMLGFNLIAKQVNVAVQDYQLGGTSCTVVVNFLTEEGNFISRNSFVLDGAAYEAWGNDDFYIVEQAAERCGFELLP